MLADDAMAVDRALQPPETPQGAALKYHQFKVSGVLFEVPARYMLLKPVGKGAYGIVCSAADAATGAPVAVKKIGGVFDNALDARRTLREILILRHLAGLPNVVTLTDFFPPPSGPGFRDVYAAYECLDTDLHQVVRSPQPLSPEHARFICYQMLRGLAHCHAAGVLHRDIKPSNLLLNANCDLKICDFGLAAAAAGPRDGVPEYVVTRWYRAPELLLSCRDYGPAVDAWSAGCVFAEVLGRRPLFPGRDYVHQLSLVCKVVGTPGAAALGRMPPGRARDYLASLPPCAPADLGAYFPDAPAEALDLLRGLLAFDPAERLTPAAALAHPYLAPLHDPADEPPPRPAFVWDERADGAALPDVRAALFAEMVRFNPDVAFMQAP